MPQPQTTNQPSPDMPVQSQTNDLMAGDPMAGDPEVQGMPMDPAMLEDLQSQIQGADRERQRDETDFQFGKKQVDDMRQALLGDLFDTLKQNGVNLEDPASVQQFTQMLEQEDPDFAALFEYALNVLSPPVESMPGAEPTAPDAEVAPEGAPSVQKPAAGREDLMGAIGRGTESAGTNVPEEMAM